MTGSLIPGVINFRDVGGLKASTGSTRSGVLFRSGNLARVGDEGLAAIAELRLARILDLRADDEVVRDPTRVKDVPITRVPLFLGSVSSFFAEDMGLTDMYRSMVADSADRVVQVVRGVLETQPVLVHCTVGKDRTGVTVALALAAAGVDEEEIVDDYARTETMLPAERNRMVMQLIRALHPDSTTSEELATRSPAPVMRGLLSELRAQYGSPADYLRAHGVNDDEITGLRDVLIESDRSARYA